jgi:hypothetical protein
MRLLSEFEDFPWMFTRCSKVFKVLKMTGSMLADELSCCVLGLSVEELCLSRNGTRIHVSVALTAQYLNVRQTVHILQQDSADIVSLPMEEFFRHNPNYFHRTQPGSRTVTPPYQWRRHRKMETLTSDKKKTFFSSY